MNLSPTFCTTGCGFYGDPQTGLCSKCAREKAAAAGTAGSNTASATIPATATTSTTTGDSVSETVSLLKSSPSQPIPMKSSPIAIPGASSFSDSHFGRTPPDSSSTQQLSSSLNDMDYLSSHSSISADGSQSSPTKSASGRCHTCKKKTGLLGFKCRCGNEFCGAHRYADAHNCTFDYKSMEREQLRKANPIIQAKKIDKF